MLLFDNFSVRRVYLKVLFMLAYDSKQRNENRTEYYYLNKIEKKLYPSFFNHVW